MRLATAALLAALVELTGAGRAAADWWQPPQQLTWYWQLQGNVRSGLPVAAYDIDRRRRARGDHGGALQPGAQRQALRSLLVSQPLGGSERA